MIHDKDKVSRERFKQHVRNRAKTIGQLMQVKPEKVENLDKDLVQGIIETEIEFKKLSETER